STAALPFDEPKYQSASTPSCDASTSASSSARPVTMLTTPPGRSDASKTWESSSAASGQRCDGTATTRVPMEIAGANRVTNASSGAAGGQTIPITPSDSGIASV